MNKLNHQYRLLIIYCRCRHCENLKPIYEEVAKRLVPHGIKLARVNAEVATEVQEKYAIAQFPYILMFRNGQLYPYEGPGEKAGVLGNLICI